MKSLVAKRMLDGWLVKITDTRKLNNEEEVHKLIRQEGLRLIGNLCVLDESSKEILEIHAD